MPQISQHEQNRLLTILDKCEKQLEDYPGVHYVDIGFKYKNGEPTETMAIRVHLHKKLDKNELDESTKIPAMIDGVPIDIIESNPKLQVDRVASWDPLFGGVEIRNPKCKGAGTLGALVFDNQTQAPMGLSNYHVLAKGDNIAKGDKVMQPNSRLKSAVVGTLERWDRALDCAVFLLDDKRVIAPGIVDYYQGITGMTNAVVGMYVSKSGRSTGTTYGMIDGVTAKGFTIVPRPGRPFVEISASGDSGAVWLETEQNRIAGLHYAGERSNDPSKERAWAKHISQVAAKLDISVTQNNNRFLYMVWRANNSNKLHFSNSVNGEHWNIGLPMGDRYTSSDAPAIASHSNQLICAWRDESNQLRMCSTEHDFQWAQSHRLSNVIKSGPSLAVFGHRLYLAWQDESANQLYITSSKTARGLPKGKSLNNHDSSEDSPAMTAFKGVLLIVWKAKGRLHISHSSDGKAWPKGKITHPHAKIGSGPAIVSFKNRLFMTWRAATTNKIMLSRSTDGRSWSAARPIDGEDKCLDCPSLVVFNERLYLAFRAKEATKKIYTMSSTDGKQWSPAQLTNNKNASPFTPAMAVF